MRSKTITAAAGLVLALALAALSGGSSGASDGADAPEASASEDGRVHAAGVSDTPAVTMDVIAATPEAGTFPEYARHGDVPRQTPPPPPPPPPAPEPAPEPAPAPAPPGSIDDILARHFGSAAGTAKRIAQCESGLNPAAVSPGGGNHGLFQINNVHRGTFESVTGAPWSAVYDAETNTIFARWLYGQQGWGPWACA